MHARYCSACDRVTRVPGAPSTRPRRCAGCSGPALALPSRFALLRTFVLVDAIGAPYPRREGKSIAGGMLTPADVKRWFGVRARGYPVDLPGYLAGTADIDAPGLAAFLAQHAPRLAKLRRFAAALVYSGETTADRLAERWAESRPASATAGQ